VVTKRYLWLGVAGGALLSMAMACSENPLIIGRFGVDGGWSGSALAGSGADTVRFTFDLSLEQNEGHVSGTGQVHGGNATLPLEVEGTWTASSGRASVGLVMGSDSVAPVTFAGQFVVHTTAGVSVLDPDSLEGTLTGSALTGAHLRLGRTGTP
jgi:hypothetical protein